MRKIKRIIVTMILCLPRMIYAQQEEKGIKWVTDLSWEQVKQKAKTENKYIFIDAYATWCGPCKKMDSNVYVNDIVGNFFNDKFISVKIQMDKTKKDNDYVKSWYPDAEAIQKSYYVEAYPSFIFLSPEAAIVHMDKGYTNVNDFVSLAKAALTPGKVFKDTYAEYEILVPQYKQGTKNYERVPYMVKCAIKMGERDFAVELIKDHLNNYAKKQPKEKRYTKENIEMWRNVGLSTESTIFKFFYEDGKMIDKVMRQKGYAEAKVDKVIRGEFVVPFFKEQNKDSTVVFGGMYVSGGKYSKTVYQEADWEKLKDTLKAHVNSYYTEKNLLWAKGEWYRRNRNYKESYMPGLEYDRKYLLIDKHYLYNLNSPAFDVFQGCTTKEVIDGYIDLLGKEIKSCKDPNIIDTYASLLYKAGRNKEAIDWETKAVNESDRTENAYKKQLYSGILQQMKKGERPPTWEGKKMIWGYE